MRVVDAAHECRGGTKMLELSPSSGCELIHQQDFLSLRMVNCIVETKAALIKWVVSYEKIARSYSPMPNESTTSEYTMEQSWSVYACCT